MPIDLSLYPENWDEISLSVKQNANWTCEWCGRPCRPPGVSQKDTEKWLKDNHPEWLPHLFKIVEDYENCILPGFLVPSGSCKAITGIIKKPQRFTLTTAHLDHNPANCKSENLKALCSVCHLNLDRDDWNRTRKARQMKLWEKCGQLTLDLGFTDAT